MSDFTNAVIKETIDCIRPISAWWLNKAWDRLDNLTKPRRSLGVLEELAARIVAIQETDNPDISQKRICVFVGDHGVVEEGVSAYPQEVTGLMVKNFLVGKAGVNVLARRANAEVEVIDIGMADDPGVLDSLVLRNVRRGTRNMLKEPAMTIEEAEQAIAIGIERAQIAVKNGVKILGTGDMGIGNTTPSSALFAAYLKLPIKDVVGPGTGLDKNGIVRKSQVIEAALRKHLPSHETPLEILAAVGGLEIAGICGLCLGGASLKTPVVVDGFISGAAALAAIKIAPEVKDYLFFSHMSAEPGHIKLFEAINVQPMIRLNMRLGEGTGAAIGMQIMEDAVAIYNEMATFQEAGITPGA